MDGVAPRAEVTTGASEAIPVGLKLGSQFSWVDTGDALPRGMNGSLELWSRYEAVREGTMSAARRSCSLTMFNSEGKPVAKYWLEKAWPSKIDVSGLKAGASDALIETVTLTAEYIQHVAP